MDEEETYFGKNRTAFISSEKEKLMKYHCLNCYEKLDKKEAINIFFCSKDCFNKWRDDASGVSLATNSEKTSFNIPIRDASALIDLYFGYALEDLWREEMLPEDRSPEVSKLVSQKTESHLESLRVCLLEKLSEMPSFYKLNPKTQKHSLSKRQTKAKIQSTQIRKNIRKGKKI